MNFFHAHPKVQADKFVTKKLRICSYPSFEIFVMDTQKNGLIETVILSTHKICFG